jgi:hypothetical protein
MFLNTANVSVTAHVVAVNPVAYTRRKVSFTVGNRPVSFSTPSITVTYSSSSSDEDDEDSSASIPNSRFGSPASVSHTQVVP